MTLRRRLRGVLANGARWMGILRHFERRMNSSLTILMYHRILNEKQCTGYPFPSLVMPEAMFTRQATWLSDNTEVLPVAEALEAMKLPRTRPLVAVTFDDGYWDNFEIAAPILERNGLRATFFVTTDFVARDELLWFDRAAASVRTAPDDAVFAAATAHLVTPPTAVELRQGRDRAWVEALKRCPPQTRKSFLEQLSVHLDESAARSVFRSMRPEQVAELARRGHEIGSHSVSHEILPLAGDAALIKELKESRQSLKGWVGREILGFCYPNGSHDQRVVSATHGAGYSYACTTAPPAQKNPSDRLRLGRLDITPDRVSDVAGNFDLTAFRAELAGLHQALR